MYVVASNHEKFTENPTHGHQCWYPRKRHHQCLLW